MFRHFSISSHRLSPNSSGLGFFTQTECHRPRLRKRQERIKAELRMACTVDFRRLDEGFGGKTYKRKRSQQSEANDNELNISSMEMDIEEGSTTAPAFKRQAVSSSQDPNKPSALAILGRPTYDGVIAGRVSGRKWKQVRTQRASSKNVSLKGNTLEQRNREKEMKRAYRERMNELKEEIRQRKIEKRKQREDREKRKQENILRSGTKLQKITNPKTLKKIAKSKQRKQLKVVPDELLAGGNKNKK